VSGPRDYRAARYAVGAAGLTVAFQLAGKATRDALFLSTFGIAALPRMLITAAVLSAALTIGLTRVMARTGPGRLVPRLFVLSGVLLLLEWALAGPALSVTAILFYLHFSGLGALLVSGLWALVNERFDPRTARGAIGRITTGASLGGLLGGILPERVGATLSLPAMLPILAALHLLAGFLALRLRRATTPQEPTARVARAPARSPREVLLASPYLQGLALLVGLTAAAEGLLDYVFKAGATRAVPDGATLLRLFAAFYTATAVLTIILQLGSLRRLLGRLGIAQSAALLPAGSTAGALGALLLPGFGPLIVARGIEVVLHNSVFRAAYELLFTPVSPPEKRATKLLVDVGVARVGDVVAGLLVQAALFVGLASATPLLGLTMMLGICALWVARRLHFGYVGALEQSLHRRAEDLPAASDEQAATMLQSFVAFDLSQLRLLEPGQPPPPPRVVPSPDAPLPVTRAARPSSRLDQRQRDLASSTPEVVAAALADGPLAPGMVEGAIGLLAWDEVAMRAIQALGTVALSETRRLVAHLLDPEEDFAIRRRLVRVLADAPGREAFEGLIHALEDQRFEVRYRAGRALARMTSQNPTLRVANERVIAAVLREVAVERGIWESRQLIDQADDDWSPMEAEVLRDRATRSLEHVFNLLALILPPETLRLAFHGLHTQDAHLRGTALEYLVTVLPEPVRVKLWPFLEAESRPADRRNPEAVLQELLASRESIMLALAAARERGRGRAE
jgi:ATP:ADP antiporter, AAA family